MKVETRKRDNKKFLILIPESGDESLMIDSVFGDKHQKSDSGEEHFGKILSVKSKLSDGYGDHYLEIKEN